MTKPTARRMIGTATCWIAAMCLQARADTLETHNNPVPDGTIKVSAGDTDRSDWEGIPWYEEDFEDDDEGELGKVEEVDVAAQEEELEKKFFKKTISFKKSRKTLSEVFVSLQEFSPETKEHKDARRKYDRQRDRIGPVVGRAGAASR